MTDPTPDDLATLASAMGYTVTLDDSGNAGVVRVLIRKGSNLRTRAVFCPHLDAAQAWEVMAWLIKSDNFHSIGPQNVNSLGDYARVMSRNNPDRWVDKRQMLSFAHDGTAAGIRRAVVEAAIRVAKG